MSDTQGEQTVQEDANKQLNWEQFCVIIVLLFIFLALPGKKFESSVINPTLPPLLVNHYVFYENTVDVHDPQRMNPNDRGDKIKSL